MVQVFICKKCAKEAEKTKHVDLYGTPTSLLYGCKHAIQDVKAQIAEDIQGRRVGRRSKSERIKALEVTKYSKIDFKNGKLVIKGKRVAAPALKPPKDFEGW